MPTWNDQGCVLTRIDYSESSQVLVLFGRLHGKLRILGKGTKKSTKSRFKPGIDLLDVGHVVFSARHERSSTLATLVEWKQSRCYFGLREKLYRLHGATYVAEITAHLTEDWDPHTDVFDALIAALTQLDSAAEPFTPVTAFQTALLAGIGSLPSWDTCVQCGREHDLTHFSSFEGGLLCRHCEPGRVEKRELSMHTIRSLRGDMDTPPDMATFDILNYHLSHLMGREPRLAAKLAPPAQRRIIRR